MNRKNKLMWMCWLVYTVSYVGRTGYSANITAIIDRFGVTNAVAGLVGTFFFFAYACGQLTHGTLCKFYPKRYVIPAVLLVCTAINATLFFEPTFAIYKYLWLLNGISLSVLWPSLIFTLALPGNSGDVNKVTFLMSTPTIIGKLFTYGLSALLNQFGFYRWFFLVSAALTAATAISWFISFPSLNEGEDYEKPQRGLQKEGKRAKSKLPATMLIFLVVLGFTTAGNSLIKDGLSTWVPKILKDQYAMSDSASIVLSLVLPVCGLFGTMLLIGLSKLIKNNLLLCGLITLSTAALLAVIVLITNPGKEIASFIPLLVCFGVISCFAELINTLATAKLPLELAGAINSGMICGVMNFCSYGGSTVSSYALGSIADAGGWNAVFKVLLSITAGVTVLIVGTFFVLKNYSSANKGTS